MSGWDVVARSEGIIIVPMPGEATGGLGKVQVGAKREKSKVQPENGKTKGKGERRKNRKKGNASREAPELQSSSPSCIASSRAGLTWKELGETRVDTAKRSSSPDGIIIRI